VLAGRGIICDVRNESLAAEIAERRWCKELTMLRKQFIATREASDDDNTATAVISTDVIDREKEVILPRGAKIENYLKNPVVQWVHDYHAFPVGKALWAKAGRKYIKAKWEWAPTEAAQQVKDLWNGGFLNAVSIGFLPAKEGSHPPTPEEIKARPELATANRIYDDWELLEFSIVPVPANPEALAAAIKGKSIIVSEELQNELGVGVEGTTSVGAESPVAETTSVGGDEETTIINTEFGEVKIDPVLKPEETENYIRIPVRDCKPTATITISAKQGIKALYCGKIKKVRTYLFNKAKGWTMKTAKEWVKKHDSGKAIECCSIPIEVQPTDIKVVPIVQAKPFINVTEQLITVEKIARGQMY